MNPGRTIFTVSNTENGWKDLGLRPVEIWDEGVMHEWSSMARHEVTEPLRKAYTAYLKRSHNCRKTPGTAAGITLFIKGYQGFQLPGEEATIKHINGNDFLFRAKAAAHAATPFLVNQIKAWESWCKQQKAPADEMSYARFSDTSEIGDIALHSQMKTTIRELVAPSPLLASPVSSLSGFFN